MSISFGENIILGLAIKLAIYPSGSKYVIYCLADYVLTCMIIKFSSILRLDTTESEAKFFRLEPTYKLLEVKTT